MTIEELNKLIKEELDAYLGEEEGDDDIEVTTDEPAAETGEEALDLLRQIYDLIKPQVEDEMEDEEEEAEEPEEEEEETEEEEAEEVDENMDSPVYNPEDANKVGYNAEKIKGGLNESVERFKKLANIKG